MCWGWLLVEAVWLLVWLVGKGEGRRCSRRLLCILVRTCVVTRQGVWLGCQEQEEDGRNRSIHVQCD